jgi:serine/threonine-protein kinase
MASRLSLFLSELKRRRVYRVAVVYVVVGAGVIGLCEAALPPDVWQELQIPVGILILVGLPVALVLAWAYEVKPEEPRVVDEAETEAASSAGAPASAGTAPPSGSVEEEERKSIAVLPFADMSPDKDQEYFCDGMAEELINALTKVRGLRVVARTSSFHFKGRSEDVREIGARLGVRTVLEGSVRRAEDRLRVTAQLVSVEDGYHLWSESYDREMKDVFAIQDEISRSIVDTLRPTLLGEVQGALGEQQRELVSAPTQSLEAYDYYLLGRHHWEERYEKGLTTALRYFEKAVETDPVYALAHSGMADSYTIFGLFEFMEPDQARLLAESAARRALELDDSLPDAHAAMGLYQFWLAWDWERAATDFLKAIEIDPNHTNAHLWLSFLRVTQGRFEEALEAAATARRLEPLSRYVKTLSGTVRYLAEDRVGGFEELEEVVRDHPDFLLAVFMLSWGCSHRSKHEMAVRLGERAVTLSREHGHFLGSQGMMCGRAGMHKRAREILEKVRAREVSEYISPLWLGWIHLGLGEKEQALVLLAEAVARRCPYIYPLHQDPNYESLWSDPRFAELASKVGSGVVSRAWERANPVQSDENGPAVVPPAQ